MGRLLSVNHTTVGLETVMNAALLLVDEWISDHGLELVHAKTEAFMLTSKWAYRQPELYLGGILIPVNRAVKYLGVILDSRLTFTCHIKTMVSAAVASAKAVGRLMPNIDGPAATKRRLISSVVTSRFLYTAPVWSERTSRYGINRMPGSAEPTTSTETEFYVTRRAFTDMVEEIMYGKEGAKRVRQQAARTFGAAGKRGTARP